MFAVNPIPPSSTFDEISFLRLGIALEQSIGCTFHVIKKRSHTHDKTYIYLQCTCCQAKLTFEFSDATYTFSGGSFHHTHYFPQPRQLKN